MDRRVCFLTVLSSTVVNGHEMMERPLRRFLALLKKRMFSGRGTKSEDHPPVDSSQSRRCHMANRTGKSFCWHPLSRESVVQAHVSSGSAPLCPGLERGFAVRTRCFARGPLGDCVGGCDGQRGAGGSWQVRGEQQFSTMSNS